MEGLGHLYDYANEGFLLILLRHISLFGLFAAFNAQRQWMAWVGNDGIFPWVENRQLIDRYGRAKYLIQPTVLWAVRSDDKIALIPYVAMAVSLCNACHPTTAMSLLQWALFLSIHCVIPWVFDFPWYNLLSESMFLLAWAPRFGGRDPVIRILVNFLLFRVMFGFGKSKYFGGTDSWNQKARYVQDMMFNQPLATPLGWWAGAAVPTAFFALANAGTFIIEIIQPFSYWCNSPLRTTAGYMLIGLMAGIQASGNFGFFNMLTAAVATVLVFDTVPSFNEYEWRYDYVIFVALGLLAVLKLPLNSWTHDKIWFMAFMDHGVNKFGIVGRFTLAALRYTSFFKIVNGYGIFPPNTIPPDHPIIVFQTKAEGGEWVDVRYRAQSSGPLWRGAWVAPFHWFLDQLMCYEGAAAQSSYLLNSYIPKYYPHHPDVRDIVQRVLEHWPGGLFCTCPNIRDRRAVVYVYNEKGREFVCEHTTDKIARFPEPFDTLWFDRFNPIVISEKDWGATTRYLSRVKGNGVEERDSDHHHDVWLIHRKQLWREACENEHNYSWFGLIARYERRMDDVRARLLGWKPEFVFYGDYLSKCAHHRSKIVPYRGEAHRFLTTRAPFCNVYERGVALEAHALNGTIPRSTKVN